MPLPTPEPNETKDDFMSRCMADDEANEDFPDSSQRHEVCERQWDAAQEDDDAAASQGQAQTLETHEQHDAGIAGVRSVGRDELKYRRILQAVAMTPWAMEHRTWLKMVDVLEFQAAGLKLTREEIAAHVGVAAQARPRTQRQQSVQVIGLRGIIEHRAEDFDISTGGTAIQRFRTRFREALDNPDVGAIVLDVDSPGGSVDGVPEMAAEIREARGDGKPILANANTLAGSAAYFIASAADEVSATPSAEVGSIGVFAAHDDVSGMLERAGVKVTLVHAGKHKIEGNPFEPLSEDARAHLQARVDEFYQMFVDAVAEGRGVPRSAVREGMGEGRLVGAREALAEKMIDRIETLDETIGRALSVRPRRSPRGQAQLRARRFAL